MIHQIPVQQFIELAKNSPVIDVRAPAEFTNGHIPGAHNVPLFSDDERALIGTLYKQQGKQEAIRAGLEFVGPKLTNYVEQVAEIVNTSAEQPISCPPTSSEIASLHASNFVSRSEVGTPTIEVIIASYLDTTPTAPLDMGGKSPEQSNRKATVLTYCARGGMRSKSFGMLLATCGYTVYQLNGGYKAYKKYLRDTAAEKCNFVVLGGKTGSGKTKILHELKKLGEQVLDLEKLAHHKGSVFGAVGEQPQPSQEQFIVDCLSTVAHFDSTKIIWVEKESYKVGDLAIPQELWHQMQQAPIVYIEIPQEQRLQNLMTDYGSYDRELLKTSVQRLHKKLGGACVKELCEQIDVNNYRAVACTLLDYYDQLYEYGLQKSDDQDIEHIVFTNETSAEIANTLSRASISYLDTTPTHNASAPLDMDGCREMTEQKNESAHFE